MIYWIARSIIMNRQSGDDSVLQGHVVRFPMEDPAHRILNAKDLVEWNRRRGRLNWSWLAQLGDHIMKESSMGPAQARAVARNRSREWSRKVSAAKCRRGTCSHT